MTVVQFPMTRSTAPDSLMRLHNSAAALRVRIDRLLRFGVDARHAPILRDAGHLTAQIDHMIGELDGNT